MQYTNALTLTLSPDLLRAVLEWYRGQRAIYGLLTWGLVPGPKKLLQEAGQMPYTVYERLGFRKFKRVHDPRWADGVGKIDTTGAEEDPAVLRVMLLTRE